jgi:HAD superfamily hydrolase (TIGR01509 family)
VRGGKDSVSPVELVIFDCDGVLVDSEPIAVRIDLVILSQFGLQLSETEVIDRFVGRSPDAMQQAIEEHVGHEVQGFVERFAPLYDDAYRSELSAVRGVKEALDRIDLPVCVASSSRPDNLRMKLELVDLTARFDGNVFSASEVANGKPAPDLFLYAARRMGVDPSRCVVVEDSRHGVEAARAAGMRVLAYAGGLTAGQTLAGPETVVFDDMRVLPDLIAPGTAR